MKSHFVRVGLDLKSVSFTGQAKTYLTKFIYEPGCHDGRVVSARDFIKLRELVTGRNWYEVAGFDPGFYFHFLGLEGRPHHAEN